MAVRTKMMERNCAGNGGQGFTGDFGPATAATLRGPSGLAVDATGDLIFADFFNPRPLRSARPNDAQRQVSEPGAERLLLESRTDPDSARERGSSVRDGIEPIRRRRLLVDRSQFRH